MNLQQTTGLIGAEAALWQQKTANVRVENCAFTAPDVDSCSALLSGLVDLDDRLNDIRRMVGTFSERMLGEQLTGDASNKQGPQPVPSGKLGELHAALIKTMRTAELLGEQATRLTQIG